MPKIPCLVILALTLLGATVKAQNYCAANLCQNGATHIACGNKGNFAAKCPRNARMVSLASLKRTILKFHNTKRNLIASGKLARYQSAARMATMQWDDELAKMAAFNVKQCEMKHDKCRNTFKYSKSGQNLAMISYTGAEKSKTNAQLINNRSAAWWNEYKYANMNIIKQYPSGYKGPAIGHFTVFVTDRNVRVGCAASRFKRGKLNSFLIACNYATTNIIGQPVYAIGSPGRNCLTGRNAVYKNLCSTKEVYVGL